MEVVEDLPNLVKYREGFHDLTTRYGVIIEILEAFKGLPNTDVYTAPHVAERCAHHKTFAKLFEHYYLRWVGKPR